jgi:Mannose-1-phosphate guanylyltransferase
MSLIDVSKKASIIYLHGMQSLPWACTRQNQIQVMGYIEQGKEVFKGEGIYELKSFREKPDLKTAISYLEQGGFTWNSGMFMWSADVIVDEIRMHNPEIADIMDKILPCDVH